MKRLLILLILFTGCSKEPCECEARLMQFHNELIIERTIKIDCKTKQPIEIPYVDVLFLGCK
jgi:hypothetical protein